MLDIENATYEQLKSTREEINQRIRDMERAAVAELELRAKQFGFALLKNGSVKTEPTIKYRGPNGEAWSGKGKRPGWVMQLLAEGKSLDDFAT